MKIKLRAFSLSLLFASTSVLLLLRAYDPRNFFAGLCLGLTGVVFILTFVGEGHYLIKKKYPENYCLEKWLKRLNKKN
ncbi:MAG: hypothetical protein MI784_06765 [Cytophagales bacterium]|nr:hypothetical protein [Cytophagales bacterium]